MTIDRKKRHEALVKEIIKAKAHLLNHLECHGYKNPVYSYYSRIKVTPDLAQGFNRSTLDSNQNDKSAGYVAKRAYIATAAGINRRWQSYRA